MNNPRINKKIESFKKIKLNRTEKEIILEKILSGESEKIKYESSVEGFSTIPSPVQ
jgi:hypothetical protein